MQRAFKQGLAPPVFEGDEEKPRIAGEIDPLGWLMLILTVAGGLAYSRFIPEAVLLGVLSLMILMFFAVQVLLRQSQVRVASLLFIGVIWLTINGSAVYSGGARSLGFSANVLVVLGASLWLGYSDVLSWLGLSLLAGLGMVWAESLNLLPAQSACAYTLISTLTQSLFFFMAASDVQIGVRGTNAALKLAREELAQRKLAESELLKFRLGIERSGEAIFITEPDGRIAYVNPAFEKIYGFCREEVLGKTLAFLMKKEPEATVAMDLRLRRKDGYWRWFEVRGKNLLAIPAMNGIVVNYSDITERKLANDTMRENEQKFRSFIEQASDGFVLVDEQGLIVEWNQGKENIWGLKSDQVIGRTYWDVQFESTDPERRTPDHYDYLKARTLEALQKGESPIFNEPIDAEIVRPNGERRFIQQRIFPVKSGEGTRIGSVTRDITEPMRAEVELRKLSLAVEQSPVSIVITDTAGNIEYVNPKFSEITGYTREEVNGGNPSILKSSHTTPEEYEPLWQTIAEGGTWRGEFHSAAVRLGRRLALFAALLSGASVFLIGIVCTGPSWAGVISNGITLIAYLIAGYLSGTLTNATRRQIERMAALNQVAHATSSTIEMDSLLELTYQQLRRVIPTDTYYVGLYEAGSDFVELSIVFDDGKHFPPRRIPFGDGLASLVIQRRAPILIQSLSKEGSSLPIGPMVIGLAKPSESWLGVPLLMNDDFSVVIVLASYKPNAFDEDDVELLSNIAGQVALALDNARHHAQVEEQARRDSLTGAYNHGYLLKRLRGEIDAARAEGLPVSLIMLDIDHFKEYNDLYGNELGDHVLCITVNAIQARVKHTDVVGRWGGEEFGVVLKNATTEQAREVAGRIRKTLAAMPLKGGNGQTIPNPTVSQGIATFPDYVTDPNRLVDMADTMLYIAKGQGRDQVLVASPDRRA